MDYLKSDVLVFLAVNVAIHVFRNLRANLFLPTGVPLFMPPTLDKPLKAIKQEELIQNRVYSTEQIFSKAFFYNQYGRVTQLSIALFLSSLICLGLHLAGLGQNSFGVIYYMAVVCLGIFLYEGCKLLFYRGLRSYETKLSILLGLGFFTLTAAVHLGASIFNVRLIDQLQDLNYRRSVILGQISQFDPYGVILLLDVMLLALNFLSVLPIIRFANTYIEALRRTSPRRTLEVGPDQPADFKVPEEAAEVLKMLKNEMMANAVLLIFWADGLLNQFQVQITVEINAFRIVILLLNIYISASNIPVFHRYNSFANREMLIKLAKNKSQQEFEVAKTSTTTTLKSFMALTFQLFWKVGLPLLLLSLFFMSYFYNEQFRDDIKINGRFYSFDGSCPLLKDYMQYYESFNKCQDWPLEGFGTAGGYFRASWSDWDGLKQLVRLGWLSKGALRQTSSFLLYGWYMFKFVGQSGLIVFLRNSMEL